MSSPSPRRLAFFMHGFEMGGAQRRTLSLTAELARRGQLVDLVVVSETGLLRPEAGPGVRVVRLSRRAGPPSRSRNLALALSIPALAAYLRRVQPRVFVPAANHALIAGVTGFALAGLKRTALVARVSNPLAGRLRRGLLRVLFSQVDGFAAVSGQIRDQLVQLCPDGEARVHVVRNPVVDLARPSLPRPLRRRRSPEILGVGRMVRQKGFDLLIEAFARVAQARPARLTLIGDGPERARLEALVYELGLTERVTFAGARPDPAGAMADADLFVLASRYEGMPGALIEAMAEGCPVVAADCPSAREVLAGGRFGPLAPIDDPPALAEAMLAALDAPVDPELLKARAGDFSVAAATDDFMAVMQAAVRRRTGDGPADRERERSGPHGPERRTPREA